MGVCVCVCESFLSAGPETGAGDSSVSVDAQIAKIMEQQALCVVPTRKQSEETKKLKQSILTLYATVSDEEEDDDNDYEAGDSGDERGLMKNTNAEEVMKIEKSKKEALRVESQKKKDKDREDAEEEEEEEKDEKEKEKKRTMKGEKRR